jgi:hypothetical protein
MWREHDWLERAPTLLAACGLSRDFTTADVLRQLQRRAEQGGIAGTAQQYARCDDDVRVSREPRAPASRFEAQLADGGVAGSDVSFLPPLAAMRVSGEWDTNKQAARVAVGVVLRWLEARARWLDAAHGRLDVAAEWLEWALARKLTDERLERLRETAAQLSAVVYAAPADAEHVDRVLALEHFEALSLPQRVSSLFESAATSVAALQAVLRGLRRALLVDEAQHPLRLSDARASRASGVAYESPSALHGYLLALAATHCAPRTQRDAAGAPLMPFERAVALLRAAGDEAGDGSRVFADDATLLFVALQCAYACPLSDVRTLAALNELYNSLPTKPRQARTSDAEREFDALLVADADAFAKHLTAAEVLAQRGVAQPLAFFRECEQQHSKARRVLRRLSQVLVRNGASASAEQWSRLRADLLLVAEAMPFVHEKHCVELLCGALLMAREYKLAQRYLADLEGGDALCLSTARELVNGSASLTDEALREARKVLLLLRPTPALETELALIEACERLSTLKLPQPLLPAQVRLWAQPLSLLEAILQHNELLYIDAVGVMALARGIGAAASDSDADAAVVRCAIAEAALRASDATTALAHVRQLLPPLHGAAPPPTARAVRVCIETAQQLLCRDAATVRELVLAVLPHATSDDLAKLLALDREADARLLAARHHYDGAAKAPAGQFGETLRSAARDFAEPTPSRTRTHHAFYGDVFGDALCDDAFGGARADRRSVAELRLLVGALDVDALRAHLAHALRADTAHAAGVVLALARDGVDAAARDAAAATLLEHAAKTPGGAPVALWCAAMAACVAGSVDAQLLDLSASQLRDRLAGAPARDSVWQRLLADIDSVAAPSQRDRSQVVMRGGDRSELASLRALDHPQRADALSQALAASTSAADVVARVAEPLVHLADAAHAAAYSDVARRVLVRLFEDKSDVALSVREQLAAKQLPGAHDDLTLIAAVGGDALVALTSPHKASRAVGFAGVLTQQEALSDDVCDALLARCKKDNGTHALVHFAAAAGVRRALVQRVVGEHLRERDDDADTVQYRATDAFAALAHCVIACLWRTAAQVAVAVSDCGGALGGGLVSGVAAAAALLRVGEARANARCKRAAELGDVQNERAWRDNAALLIAAKTTCAAD